MAQDATEKNSFGNSHSIVEQTLRVLLIENNAGGTTTVERLLGEARGAMALRGGLFNVVHMPRLDAALALLDRDAFSVVLLDLQLPGLSGLEALERVRAAAPETPVVVLTDVDDDGLALQAIGSGAQDFVPKQQLDRRLLSRTILGAVERKRTETQLRRRARELEIAHTQIERQAAELERRNAELDRINRELEEFTYIASHDLKEPLRGIRAYSEMLREDYDAALDDEGRRRLDKMAALCGRLESLIADLLTYCRVGGMRPTMSTVDLDTVAEEVLDMLQPAVEDRKAEIELYGPLPQVSGDATMLGLALANLISNGLKFNRSRCPRVEIGTTNGEQPTLYIRDNGIGIDARHHEAVFAMFRRLHGRREYEGSGAGLSIVRKVVDSHGGRVWLESEPGKGTTFYLALPPATATGTIGPPHWARCAEEAESKRGKPTGERGS